MLLPNKQPRTAATEWEDSMAKATGVSEGAAELYGAAKKASFLLAAGGVIRSFAFNADATQFIDKYSRPK